MNPRVSPYLQRIRNWKIQYIVAHYLNSYELFRNLWEQHHENKKTTFSDWCRLCDFLFEAKEANNLLFSRENVSATKNDRQPGRYVPTTIEATLMNNIGLLFHKAMVMREWRYVQDQYVEENSEFQQNQIEIEHIFRQMKKLYTVDSTVLLAILRDNGDNMPLLSFFLEKKTVIEQLYDMSLHEIFESHFGPSWLGKTYGAVSHYFDTSGWHDRAKFVRQEIQKIKESSDPFSGNITGEGVPPE
ncbi:hypothetical protein KAH55_02035 [bacterium]|nr:hypothetical protein [bacterium]